MVHLRQRQESFSRILKGGADATCDPRDADAVGGDMAAALRSRLSPSRGERVRQ
jgi:hypothetical protein